MSPLLTYILSFSVLSFASASSTHLLSCSQTPYTDDCKASYIFDHNDTQINFRNSVISSSLDKALYVHKLASAVNLSALDGRTRSAWLDCMKLCEYTIDLLNRSVRSMDSISAEDTQTWLSASMANQQTCLNGFIESNSPTNLLHTPFFSNNLSESISHSLYVNKAIRPVELSNKTPTLIREAFPSWISFADQELLRLSNSSVKADLVVAKDGSGDHQTISEAITAALNLSDGVSRFVVLVKAGVYNEKVIIPITMKNLMVVGDGINATIITGSMNVQDGSTTFNSATFFVEGDGFIAKDITFENTAGPLKGQAVALLSKSDLSVYYHCSFKGYQDTLYVHSQRQFYRECDIYGTIDFIFGDAVTVLQNCNIYVRKPLHGQGNMITAQGRSDPNENTGISVHMSRVMAAPDLKQVQRSFKTYLGRPWKKYARTVFMKCSLDDLIDPAGWNEWNGDFLSTLYYGEYMNTGTGSSTDKRVNWPGYHIITSVADASNFTVGNFIFGDYWISATGVPFTSSL